MTTSGLSTCPSGDQAISPQGLDAPASERGLTVSQLVCELLDEAVRQRASGAAMDTRDTEHPNYQRLAVSGWMRRVAKRP